MGWSVKTSVEVDFEQDLNEDSARQKKVLLQKL
jgi:hypothetical protein